MSIMCVGKALFSVILTSNGIVGGNLSSCALLVYILYTIIRKQKNKQTFINEMPFELTDFILASCVRRKGFQFVQKYNSCVRHFYFSFSLVLSISLSLAHSRSCFPVCASCMGYSK